MSPMLLLVPVVLATTPFRLPAAEPTEPWVAALRLSGFATTGGLDADGAWAELHVVGSEWTLIVRDRAGAQHEVRVNAPSTPRQREDVAWLAASLLDPGEPPFAGPAPPSKPGVRHPPVAVPPVAAPPIVAPPIVAPPIVAQPVVAQPIVAQPIVAQPIVAQPVVVPPVAAPAVPPQATREVLDVEPPIAKPPTPRGSADGHAGVLLRGGAAPALTAAIGGTLHVRSLRAGGDVGATSRAAMRLESADAGYASLYADLWLGGATMVGPLETSATGGMRLSSTRFTEKGALAGSAWIPAFTADFALGRQFGPLQLSLATTVGWDLRGVQVSVAGAAQDRWAPVWVQPSVTLSTATPSTSSTKKRTAR